MPFFIHDIKTWWLSWKKPYPNYVQLKKKSDLVGNFTLKAGPEVIPVFLIELHGGKTKGTGNSGDWKLAFGTISNPRWKNQSPLPFLEKGNSPENAELLWSSSRKSTLMTMLPSKTGQKELPVFLHGKCGWSQRCILARWWEISRSLISALLSLMVPPRVILSQCLQSLCKDILTS